MNKGTLGLYAWGNVVQCCQQYNTEKQQKEWREFLTLQASQDKIEPRLLNIHQFVTIKKYDPNLNLHEYADNLYEDVGAVAMTLIHLRYKQAEAGIQQLLKPNLSTNSSTSE